MYFRDAADFLDQHIFVRPAHVVRRRAKYDSGHVVHAIPAGIGAADTHVDRRPLSQNLLCDIRDPPDDLVGRICEACLESANNAPGHAFYRRQQLVELFVEVGRTEADRQPDIGSGDCVHRHQVRRCAALDRTNIYSDPPEHVCFALAG